MNQTPERIKSSVYGSFFFTGFGAIWLWMGWAAPQPAFTMQGVSPTLCALPLFAAGFLLLRRTNRVPSTPRDEVERRMERRAFGMINLFQWLAVFAAAMVLGALHRSAYIAPAIVLIVGLHLFPLARLFSNPLHSLTGTALVVWTIVCFSRLPQDRLEDWVCTGSGLILLAASAAMLLIGYRACGSLESVQARGRGTHVTFR